MFKSFLFCFTIAAFFGGWITNKRGKETVLILVGFFSVIMVALGAGLQVTGDSHITEQGWVCTMGTQGDVCFTAYIPNLGALSQNVFFVLALDGLIPLVFLLVARFVMWCVTPRAPKLF